MISDELHGHPWTLYISIHHKTSSDEIWIVRYCECQVTSCLFYMRCLERMIGWSMHNWAQRRAVLVADEGQLWQLDILLWLPKVCMCCHCCHWPPKNHPKPGGPSDAVKRQDTGSVDRVDFSQMTGTRSGYLSRRLLPDGHMMATKTAPKLQLL